MFGNEIRSINRVQLNVWHETWTSPNGYHRLHHSKAAGDEGFYPCASSSYNSINSRRGIPASHNPMTDLMGAYTTSEIFGAVQDVLFLHTAMPQFTARSSGWFSPLQVCIITHGSPDNNAAHLNTFGVRISCASNSISEFLLYIMWC